MNINADHINHNYEQANNIVKWFSIAAMTIMLLTVLIALAVML